MAKKIGELFVSVGADTTKLKRGLDDSKGLLTQTKDKFDDLKKSVLPATGVLVGFGVALGKTWNTAKEGAALEYAASKFDRLAASAGTTANVLMHDLRQAVKGTRSDAELMASAGDFMALGLAKTADEVVRLTRVAGGLNMDMNQLVLTLANQTTMRFDQLGVSVDGFEERVKSLEDAGMSASDAFKEAFLQQAEQQLQKVGDVADTTAGKMAALETKVKNLGDSFKLKLAPAAANFVTSLDVILTGKDQIQAALRAHEEEVRTTAKSYEDYVEEMQRAAKAAGYHYDALGLLRDGLNRVQDGHYLLSQVLWDNGDALDFVGRMTRTATDNIGEMAAETDLLAEKTELVQAAISGKLADALGDYDQNVSDLKREYLYLNAELDRTIEKTPWLTEKIDGLTKALKDNKTAQQEAYLALKDTTKEIIFQELSAGLTGQALWDFALATGNLTEEAYYALTASKNLREEFDKGEISAYDMGRGVDTLSSAIAMLKDKDITITVTTIERTIHEMYEQDHTGESRYGGFQDDTGGNSSWENVNGGTEPTINTGGGTTPKTYDELKLEREDWGAPSLTINMNGPISSDVDVETLAYRVGEVIKQRSR